MALDKWIALIFLVIALIYGYASYTYPLLPFERNMVFLPNTMPMVLSGLGILLSLIIILTPTKTVDADGDALGDFDIPRLRDNKTGQALGLIAACTGHDADQKTLDRLAADYGHDLPQLVAGDA